MRLIIGIILFHVSTISAQEIQKNIFGFATSNTFTYCNLSDTFFINKVKAINPQVLRFPGGAVGNFYHYGRNGYGFDFEEIAKYDGGRFVERSKALVRENIKKGHTHDYIDDFIKIVKLTNSKVVLVANIFAKNDDILKMISKIQLEDIEIIGVELGSELSNRTFYQKGYKIDDYIADAKDCSNKIKKSFPNLKTAIVAAPLHPNPKHRHSTWNKALSELDFYDDIIVHSYAKVVKGKKEFGQMLTVEPEGESPKHTFEIYKKRALRFLKLDFMDEIEEYNSLFNKPIWITEWNLQMSKVTGNTMLQALFVGNYFLELLSNQDLKNIIMTTYHNLGGRDYSGSIFSTNTGSLEIRSTYYPLKMIGELFSVSDQIKVQGNEIQKQVFEYLVYKDNKLDKRIIVNWSEKRIRVNNDNIQQVRLHSYYSKNLYDKADVDGMLSMYSMRISDKSDIVLEPYSFSLISFTND